MSGLLYSKKTWVIAIVVMAMVFCFQLGVQFSNARNDAAGERLEQGLAQWTAREHPDDADDCAWASVADHQDVAP